MRQNDVFWLILYLRVYMHGRHPCLDREAERKLRTHLGKTQHSNSVLDRWVRDNLRDEARRVAAERGEAA